MKILKKELLRSLISGISESESNALKNDTGELVISRYNRSTVVRMLALQDSPTDAEELCGDDEVDLCCVDALKDALAGFLNRYMADRPEGHKWIILCCIFLDFIAEEPMHPQEVVHWKTDGKNYFCGCREDSEDSLCRWCVSKRA